MGMGKAGLIAQKVAATLASTGTRSHFLHPAEAVHGDLGRVHGDDVMLVLSQSGETEEVVRLLPSLASFGVPLIAVTASRDSTLGRAASVVIELGPLQEACALGLAPSTSTTAMLAVGDALALVTSRMRQFQPRGFCPLSSGRQPRPAAEPRRRSHAAALRVPVASESHSDSRSARAARPPRPPHRGHHAHRCPGPAARACLPIAIWPGSSSSRRDSALDQPIREVMTARPRTVPAGSMMVDAVAIMAERKISELPVIDADGRPLGLIDITDVVGLFPEAPQTATAPAEPAPPAAKTPPQAKAQPEVDDDGPIAIPFRPRIERPAERK